MAGAPVKGGKGKNDKTKSDVTPMIQGVVFDRSSAVKTQKLQVDRPSEGVSKNTVASTFSIGSMGLVYLPTFSEKINHSWIGKYTSPMDPLGLQSLQQDLGNQLRWIPPREIGERVVGSVVVLRVSK